MNAELVVAIVVAIVGSNGLWALIQTRVNNKDAASQMLLGIGHDRIIALCEAYIQRGYISHDEFENLVDYLYKPYKSLGGNGTAERLVEEVKKLPVKAHAD